MFLDRLINSLHSSKQHFLPAKLLTISSRRLINSFSQLLLIITMILLTACATTTGQLPSITQTPANWPYQQQKLAQLSAWHLQGRIAVHAGQKGGSASVFWQQQQNTYLIELFGPLGAGAVSLQGAPGNIVLREANGQSIQAATPEVLLQQVLGYGLPVTPLYYWVRGIPAPHVMAYTLFNSQGQLAQLQQEGWQINYLSYTDVEGFSLPQQISLTAPGITIKLIMDHWQI